MFIAIREATTADYARLQAAVERFLARHPHVAFFRRPDSRAWNAEEMVYACAAYDIIMGTAPRMAGMWKRTAQRALRHVRATEIRQNTVGYQQEDER